MRTDTGLGGQNIIRLGKKHGKSSLRVRRRDYAIRLAVHADLPSLCQLERRSFPNDHFSERALARHAASPRAACFVAERRGRVIGFALVLFRKGQRFGRLVSLAVLAQAREGGVGSALLAAAELACQRRGLPALQLECRRVRAGFYGRRGYELARRLDCYYADGGNALRLRKALKPLAPANVVAFQPKD